MTAQSFKLEIEAEAFYKATEPTGRQRRIGGWVSTDHLDKQGEILIQEGLDFSPFLKSGFFNDNHLKTTGKAVGYPEVAELRERPDGGKGWYVEGYLLEGHPPADEIWSLAQSLERSGAPRRLGYSVEGAVLERDLEDRRTVRKAVVREVAVTRCPINDQTQFVMLAKSLSAGHATNVGDGPAAPGDGGPLRVESLEADPKEREKQRLKKMLRKSDAVEVLMLLHPQCHRGLATRIVEYAQRHHGAVRRKT